MPDKVGFIGSELDLQIKQGSTFGPMEFTVKNPDKSPMNLTGCTVRGQIRKKALDTELVATFDAMITEAVAGKFTLGLSAESTSQIVTGELLNHPSSLFTYDVELVDSLTRVIPILYGKAFIFREVTR